MVGLEVSFALWRWTTYDDKVVWLLDGIVDCSMAEIDKEITRCIWNGFSCDSRRVDLAILDGYQSLVLIMWWFESMMFEVVVEEWVVIIS